MKTCIVLLLVLLASVNASFWDSSIFLVSEYYQFSDVCAADALEYRIIESGDGQCLPQSNGLEAPVEWHKITVLNSTHAEELLCDNANCTENCVTYQYVAEGCVDSGDAENFDQYKFLAPSELSYKNDTIFVQHYTTATCELASIDDIYLYTPQDCSKAGIDRYAFWTCAEGVAHYYECDAEITCTEACKPKFNATENSCTQIEDGFIFVTCSNPFNSLPSTNSTSTTTTSSTTSSSSISTTTSGAITLAASGFIGLFVLLVL